ncbi:MAG: hypothetical protein H6739_18990 [Alphaproteobacteria bacterium]|nr:hypothetical protein [Alphaproteobacteria bacterium]
MRHLLLLLAVAPLGACSGGASPTERAEPTFLEVTLVDGETGSAEAPLPFSAELQSRTVRVTALDVNGDPVDFSGDLTLDVRPGRLEMSPWATVTGGTWEGEVLFRNGFGPTRIWFSDLGDKDIESARVPGYATGVSEELWFELPTLAEMNNIDDHETNQLEGEFAELRAADRDLRVIAVGPAGYWVTDMADPPGSYNYLFVYTFSRPDPPVEVGSRITLLTGSTQEYLATTQISFPHYDVGDDPIADVPEPEVIPASRCEDNDWLEGWESAVVTLEDVRVPASFVQGSEDYLDYLEYGQWPVLPSGEDRCTFFVNTSVSVPDYAPQAGAELTSVTGTLSEVWGRWILNPRGAEDLTIGAGGPPPLPGTGPAQPRPRPRPQRDPYP